MIRESISEDISDEEFEKIIKPFDDNYDEYLESYILPEVIAYYLANAFYRGAMWKASFIQHYNSAKDVLNVINEDYQKVKQEVVKLLRVKYALEIINENPLDFKKIQF